MKRATLAFVKVSAKSGDLAHEHASDILASDARQRAEIRRLRKATMALMVDVVGKFGAAACVDARLAVINALAPKRRARK